jgi:hypothetical protein
MLMGMDACGVLRRWPWLSYRRMPLCSGTAYCDIILYHLIISLKTDIVAYICLYVGC